MDNYKPMFIWTYILLDKRTWFTNVYVYTTCIQFLAADVFYYRVRHPICHRATPLCIVTTPSHNSWYALSSHWP